MPFVPVSTDAASRSPTETSATAAKETQLRLPVLFSLPLPPGAFEEMSRLQLPHLAKEREGFSSASAPKSFNAARSSSLSSSDTSAGLYLRCEIKTMCRNNNRRVVPKGRVLRKMLSLSSQMAKANIPSSLRKLCSLSSLKRWRITSVSLADLNLYPLASSSCLSSR